jgi:hypothetical protein
MSSRAMILIRDVIASRYRIGGAGAACSIPSTRNRTLSSFS